jgi:hypothetical protein
MKPFIRFDGPSSLTICARNIIEPTLVAAIPKWITAIGHRERDDLRIVQSLQ